MENTIKTAPVETGMPVPRTALYQFLDTLEAGQSVLVEGSVNKQSLKACINYRQRRYGKKFATRTVPEGYRVWRLQ
jgi:hypothetical protein